MPAETVAAADLAARCGLVHKPAAQGDVVCVNVSASPPNVLGPGPRVAVRTDRGEGEIVLNVQAASCLGRQCRLHQRRIAQPVRLRADATNTVVTL